MKKPTTGKARWAAVCIGLATLAGCGWYTLQMLDGKQLFQPEATGSGAVVFIGGADGPTTIYTSGVGGMFGFTAGLVLVAVLLVGLVFAAIRLRRRRGENKED